MSETVINMSEFLEKPEQQTEDDSNTAAQPPEIYELEWHDYVMGKFAENELVKDNPADEGYPKVAGLRRVAWEVLGPIVTSVGELVQAPIHLDKDNRTPAISKHTIVIRSPRYGLLTYQDIGEARSTGNKEDRTLEGKFSKFEISISKTRAEARALRTILQLRTVANEERDGVDSNAFDCHDHPIQTSQIKAIERFCNELNIDPIKFINSGRERYKGIKEISQENARKMIEKLTNWKASGQIPDKVKIQEQQEFSEPDPNSTAY